MAAGGLLEGLPAVSERRAAEYGEEALWAVALPRNVASKPVSRAALEVSLATAAGLDTVGAAIGWRG